MTPGGKASSAPPPRITASMPACSRTPLNDVCQAYVVDAGHRYELHVHHLAVGIAAPSSAQVASYHQVGGCLTGSRRLRERRRDRSMGRRPRGDAESRCSACPGPSPSKPGTSRMPGTSASAGWLHDAPGTPARPISPSPMFSCRSRFEPKRRLGVVQVEHHEAIEAAGGVEARQRLVQTCGRSQVEPGGEDVRGVETDAEPRVPPAAGSSRRAPRSPRPWCRPRRPCSPAGCAPASPHSPRARAVRAACTRARPAANPRPGASRCA